MKIKDEGIILTIIDNFDIKFIDLLNVLLTDTRTIKIDILSKSIESGDIDLFGNCLKRGDKVTDKHIALMEKYKREKMKFLIKLY